MEENMDESQSQKGCKECCERCVGSLPWASLIATILLYMGVALFCGCGHEALSGTVTILQNYFEVIRAPGETLDVFTIIDILKYIIYGLAAGFFVFGVLLLVEGFFTTGAIRDLYGEFKITACGRCLTAFLMALAANWGYLKDASRMQKYEDIKSKEEQELHDIHSTRSKERLNAYT